MTAPKSPMSQENFAATSRHDAMGRNDAASHHDAAGLHAADFSTDTGALAYANAMLDKLVAAMRYKLEKHIIGWPGDDRELDTHEALRHLLRDFNFGHSAYV